jgi:phenylpyruvate tautomerase PptA (4-oxalocrotonate tautomerase family)
MPCVRITTGKWGEGLEIELMEAVQSALVSAFKIPESDRDVVLDLYEESRRLVSHGRSERYTRVEILGIAERSLNAKRVLFKTIVKNLQSVGVPKSETRIVLVEPPADSWGVKGGIPASEVDLGFKIDV